MTNRITQSREPILGLMRNASISSDSNIPAKSTSSKALPPPNIATLKDKLSAYRLLEDAFKSNPKQSRW